MCAAPGECRQARACELELKPERIEVRRARRRTREQLLEWGLGEAADLVDVAELLVTELVANAIVYVEAPARLRLVYDGALRIEVADPSPEPPEVCGVGSEEECGRGLELVGALTGDWGWAPCEGGKLVWCRLAVPVGSVAPLP